MRVNTARLWARNLPSRTIGGTILVFGLLATVAYHANEPVRAKAAPSTVCAPAVKATSIVKEV